MVVSRKLKSDFEKVPVNRFFKYRLISRSDTYAEIALPLRPGFLQEEGVVQGGILCALADTTAVYLLYPDLSETRTMTSIEFKMNFLRPALLKNGELRACSTLVKKGRKVALCEVEVFQKKKLLAKGMFTYLLFEK